MTIFCFSFHFSIHFYKSNFVNGTFKNGNAINIFKYEIMIDFMVTYVSIIYQD